MKELQNQQLYKVSQVGFLLDQMTFNFPGLYIWVSGLVWIWFATAGKPYRFIGWAIAIVITILVIAHGKSYYAMGAYPILFSFGAVCLERRTARSLIYLRYVFVSFTFLAGCFMDTLVLPFLRPQQLSAYYAKHGIVRDMGFFRWEDQKNNW